MSNSVAVLILVGYPATLFEWYVILVWSQERRLERCVSKRDWIACS